MYPWGHLAVGYLVYTLWTHLRFRAPPASGPTIALAVGTQFPDLVDKPLNFWFGIFDGRAIGHSALTMVPLCLVVVLLARRYGYGRAGGAFAVGVLLHLPADAWRALLEGSIQADAAYLLWPLLPAPTYPADSPGDHLEILVTRLGDLAAAPAEALGSVLMVNLLLAVALLGVWLYDGYPGLAPFRTLVTRYR